MNDRPVLPVVEPPGISLRFAALLFLSLTALIVVALIVTWMIFWSWTGGDAARRKVAREHSKKQSTSLRSSSNAVPLSLTQREQRRTYLRKQQELLTTYGWIDRQQGIVHIPIDEACARFLENERSSQ